MKKNEADYVKANRRGSREAELMVSVGWMSRTKIHKDKKKYNRKDQTWKSQSDLFLTNTLSKSGCKINLKGLS